MNSKIKNKIKVFLTLIIMTGIAIMSSSSVASKTEDQINSEIKDINSEIKTNKDKLSEIEKKKAQYTQEIKERQQERATLENQLAILENRIAKTEIEIEALSTEIKRVNLEIKKVKIEIENKENEIEKEKEKIASTIKLIYKEGDASTLEIILLNDSLTSFLNKTKYLEDISTEMNESLAKIKQYKYELESEEKSLNQKNEELEILKEDLGNSKLSLEEEKQEQIFIIEATKSSESRYQSLLAAAKKEQEQAAIDIANLEKEVRQRINNLDDKTLELNDNGLAWPVPKNKITAYFHDPDYPYKHIFEHPAIDIRAGQGTTLKAAASGYVAKSKIIGTSYGYIMIIHGDGISTVYGHVSKSFVKEDDYVVQGQVIGLTGGMPGTTGSGNLTSGPHLHFEVRKDGIPVNPLEYLP